MLHFVWYCSQYQHVSLQPDLAAKTVKLSKNIESFMFAVVH
jgi:hypothetical protein